VVLFWLAFSVVGVSGGDHWAQELGGSPPAEDSWVVGDVRPDTAAAAAGLEAGDQIVTIAGQPVPTWEDLGEQAALHPDEDVTVVVVRDGESVELDATMGSRPGRPEAGEDPEESYGFLGITASYAQMPTYRASPVRGLEESVQTTADIMQRTVVGLVGFFTGGVDDFAANVAEGGNEPATTTGSQASGQTVSDEDANRPMSIFGIARFGAGVVDDGLGEWLILMAIVNISIGLLNMIPLLPLDGGHVAIATYERIRSIGGRRYMADVSRLLPITYAVVMFMVMLGVSAIYLDIVDPIG
jgi:membrane-associated protease RseP (regulator of RpoE activity)